MKMILTSEETVICTTSYESHTFFHVRKIGVCITSEENGESNKMMLTSEENFACI
jgi:hypothetical protein